MNALTWMEPGTVSAMGWTLVHFVWQGAAAAAVLAAANALLRGSSPRLRHGAALVTLLAMLALPVVTFLVVRGAPAEPAVTPVASSALSAVESPLRDAAGVRPLAETFDPMAFLPALVAGWAAGVLLLSLRTLGGWAFVWRLRRSGRLLPELQATATALARRMRLWRPVRVCESLLVEVPTAIGWLKPVILLPPATLMGLSPVQLELVLAHELAHIRRLDPLVALVQAVAETLLFYHPLVWWVSHRLRVEREECCDDAAVAQCGNPLAYARTLTALAEMRLRAPRPVMALSGGSLAARVRRLVSAPPGASVARWPVALLILLAAGLAVVTPVTLRAAAQTTGSTSASEGSTFVVEAAEPAAAEPAQDPGPEAPARRPTRPLASTTGATAEKEAVPAPRAFTPAELVSMARAGVSPEYVEELEALGHRGLSSEQLIALRMQGVTPDYVRELAREGLSGRSVGSLMQLRAQGVTAEYAHELHAAGAGPFSALELMMLRNQGVQPEDVAALKAMGHTQLTAPRLVALRNQGVTADYMQELKDLGYPQLSLPILIALRNQGVTPDYVRELQELGYRGLTPPVLIELRNQGVTPDWVRELKEAGWTGLSTDELARLRSEGFQPSGWRLGGDR